MNILGKRYLVVERKVATYGVIFFILVSFRCFSDACFLQLIFSSKIVRVCITLFTLLHYTNPFALMVTLCVLLDISCRFDWRKLETEISSKCSKM